MKTLFSYLLGMFAIMSLSNCANGKKLQEKAPVAFLQPYYTIHLAQDDSNATRTNLYIPTEDFDQKKVQLDSVYFRGRRGELIPSEQQPGTYVAYFEITGKDEEFVMHADPRKEYGNKVPVLEKIPFDLKADEAVIVYRIDEKTRYYKLHGLKEKGSAQEK